METNERITLVTGASGFMGRWVVRALRKKGVQVRAGIGPSENKLFADDHGVEPTIIELSDRQSLAHALEGVDYVYHFEELAGQAGCREEYFRINAAGTRNLWECAVERGVIAALYCSNVAVYGLLASSKHPVSEDIIPRAVEPYGRSKLLGESEALKIATKSGMATIIIRPAATFGPGGHSPFAYALRNAAVSRILLAGSFKGKRFSYVHVEDVAEAAVHLMQSKGCFGEIFNVAAESQIFFDDAFRVYAKALSRCPRPLLRARFLALVSLLVQKSPAISELLSRYGGDMLAFTMWRPGYDTIYSSSKLIATSFRFSWSIFEDIILSCIDPNYRVGRTIS